MTTYLNLTESLVWAVARTEEADTEPAFTIAKQGLLDYLSAAWKGEAQKETDRLLRYVSGSGQALLLGSGQGASAELSALYNGYLGHYLDYDDVNQTVRGHPSTVLYPALMAVASLRPVTGKRFLAAYVIGAEVMARLAQAMGQQHYRKGFHNTATLGVLASAMATGYLLQLGAERLLNAMGIAAAQVSGIRLNFGTESKPLQAGLAAQKGVQAALLAEAGIAAGHTVLDGSQGIFALYGEGIREDTREILLGKWGRSWKLCTSGLWFKMYPFCSAASHIADSAKQLYQRESFSPEEIQKVMLVFPPGGDAALIHRCPTTGEEGRFSAEYVAAVGLNGLSYTLDNFSCRPISANLRQFMERTERRNDATIIPAETAMPPGRFCIVQLYLKNGRILKQRTDTPKGCPGNPLTSEERYQKLLACCPETLVSKLLGEVERLHHASDMSSLIQVLKTGAGQASG